MRKHYLSNIRQVAVLVPYWAFWEKRASHNLREDRLRLVDQVEALLSKSSVEVCWKGFVDSLTAGVEAAEAIRLTPAAAILVVQSMAVAPAYTLSTLNQLPDLPVIIWALDKHYDLPAEYDAADITAAGSTVGSPMLTNVLNRYGRCYILVAGRIHDSQCVEKVVRALAAGSVASAISKARIARVGKPIEGYDCVDVNDQLLKAAMGIEVVVIDPDEVRRRYLEVGEDQVNALAEEVRSNFDIDPDAEGESFQRSMRFGAALEKLDKEKRLSAGAMNCHVPEIRFSDVPGITPCFALGRETSLGIPWSCTGDVITAIALLAGKLLSGAALYHELEAIDYLNNEIAIANSGEHDLIWYDQRCKVRPQIKLNKWFLLDTRCGVCARFEMKRGPATLISFTPHHAEPSGFRFIAAEGHITGRHLPHNPTVGGAFRFAGEEPVSALWQHWVNAGVNHHSAITPGHIAVDIGMVAKFLKVGFIKVS